MLGRFTVSPGIQVISEFLESLIIPLGFLQPLCTLLLMFSDDILQYRPCTVNRTHLPGCAEEGGFSHLLDAGMATGDEQLNSVSPRSLGSSKS